MLALISICITSHFSYVCMSAGQWERHCCHGGASASLVPYCDRHTSNHFQLRILRAFRSGSRPYLPSPTRKRSDYGLARLLHNVDVQEIYGCQELRLALWSQPQPEIVIVEVNAPFGGISFGNVAGVCRISLCTYGVDRSTVYLGIRSNWNWFTAVKP